MGAASASYDYDVYQPRNGDAYYTCADGHIMTLKNNPDAERPTYEQVINFIEEDETDEIPYDIETFHCVDYAETLHNNAERSGIKCGVVDVVYRKEYNKDTGKYDTYGHECNVFRLKDGSKLYVDCTQSDFISTVVIGEVYSAENIYDGQVYDHDEIIDVRRYW